MVKKKSSLQRTSLRNQNVIRLLLLAGIILLVNIISSFYFTRIDLTTEKRFTLSPTTIKLVSELEDIIYVRVFLEGDFPPGFRNLQNATRELLDELRIYANGNIEYEFINPSDNTDAKARDDMYRQLASKGIQPTNLREQGQGSESQKIIFPGALITYRSKEVPLMLLQDQAGESPEQMLNNSIQLLEYAFANTIRKIKSVAPQRVLFLTGQGEADEGHVADITRELKSFYEVERKSIDEKLTALKGFDAVIIASPSSAFSDKDKFVIDQYIMKGGKVIWLVDGANADMDSLQNNDYTMAMANDVNLGDMLFRYGARINYDLVLDLQAAPIPIVTGYVGNRPQQSLLPWYYFPVVIPDSKHPVVNNLNAIRFEFASSMDTVGPPAIKKTVLLQSSKYSKNFVAPVKVDLEIMKDEPDVNQFNRSSLILALLLEGEFTSNFKNRLVGQISDNDDIGFSEKSVNTAMIVVADGSVIKNGIKKSTGTVVPLGLDRYTNQVFGNKNFILNCVDYLCDDSGLMTVRSKEFRLRLLDKTRVDTEKKYWQLFNILLPVLLLLCLAVFKYIYRRRKYA
jgi:gliding motility-associatede transport system auxiliary component